MKLSQLVFVEHDMFNIKEFKARLIMWLQDNTHMVDPMDCTCKCRLLQLSLRDMAPMRYDF